MEARLGALDAQALYQAYRPELERMVLGILGDRAAAADVVQTVFAKLIEIAEIERPDLVRSWLYRVAANEALLVGRQRSRWSRARRKLEAWWSPPREEPHDRLVRAETIEQVRRAIDGLPAEQREVVVRRVHEQQTFAQIADDLKVPLGTVLTRMRLAQAKLRQALAEKDR